MTTKINRAGNGLQPIPALANPPEFNQIERLAYVIRF